jgi:hypothetical protein
MRIIYYHDDTLDLDLKRLCIGLNDLSGGVKFIGHNDSIQINGKVISSPKTYESLKLPDSIKLDNRDRVLIATKKRYDNNYFYQYTGNVGIFSFAGWDRLTNLSEINGLVYFTCQLFSDSLDLGESHDDTTGCLNDFLWDKTGVDIGMRSAFLCPNCIADFDSRKHNKEEKEIFTTLKALLDQLCLASRSGLSLNEYWGDSEAVSGNRFDVFLCHNSKDKDSIRELNTRLKDQCIKTWLDEEQLRPGIPWQDELETQIQAINTVVMAVGSSGTGPWQDVEIRAFLGEFVRRGCPVIPLLLPDCKTIPKLPLFLNQFTWVDLRKPKPDPFKLLLWGITGRKH